MSEPSVQGKSHHIPKRLVWDAWLKVKKNGGAAGVDGVTIEQFEEGLKDNLLVSSRECTTGFNQPRPGIC